MEKIQFSLDDYLAEQAAAPNRLARLLEHPDPARGVVHTPREIAQQPWLWRHTARGVAREAKELRAFLETAGLYAAENRPAILFAGAGTSDYVGRSLVDLLRRGFRTDAASYSTTRMTARPEDFLVEGRRYLMVHFARSGNSPESRAVLEALLDHHAEAVHHVVITCNDEGALAQLARQHPERVYLLVLHEACNDEGLAMTSSFSCMVTAGQALVHLDDVAAFVEQVDRVATAGGHVLYTYAVDLYCLANPALERAFYLGNADLLGAAAESALKVQELTAGQVLATCEDTLAFRHGPISAVDSHSLIGFFLSEDPYTRRYELDVLRQYRAAFQEMGARTLVVSAQPPDVDPPPDVVVAYDPEGLWRVPVGYQANLAVLVGQLVGLFAAYRRHCHVDDPSVDKALYHRTVQGVKLYGYTDGNSAP